METLRFRYAQYRAKMEAAGEAVDAMTLELANIIDGLELEREEGNMLACEFDSLVACQVQLMKAHLSYQKKKVTQVVFAAAVHPPPSAGFLFFTLR